MRLKDIEIVPRGTLYGVMSACLSIRITIDFPYLT
jgi:hypothetical protein